MNAKSVALRWFDDNYSRLTALSDAIWGYAELAFNEVKSSKALTDELAKEGFAVEFGVAGMPTAFVASWGKGGPTVGFLAEYDAIAGVSQKVSTVKEAVEPGKPGHGCGHNLLGVGSVGASIALKKALEQAGLQATIKLFGCPAEEGGAAKVFMVREGVFKGVDVVMRWHPSMANWVSMAKSLAMDSMKFTFHGKAAHAGINPHLGRSALDAAILMDIGVNYLREHVMSDVRIHSVITKGGEAPNVVPPIAQIWYYVRAPKRVDVEQVSGRLRTIAQAAAMMTETTVEILPLMSGYETLPIMSLSEVAYDNLKAVGGPKYTGEEKAFAAGLTKGITRQEKEQALRASSLDPRLAEFDVVEGVEPIFDVGKILPISTDSADVSWVTPTLILYTCAQCVGTANHSWQQVAASGMGIGHKAMVTAGKVMAATAIDLIEHPETLAKVKAEHAALVKDTPYKSPIPPEVKPGIK